MQRHLIREACFQDVLLNGPLNSGDQSRPVECETRWPEGQIRWPRANGPVLTAGLFNVNEQLTLETLHQVVGDLAGLRSSEQRLRVFVVVFKCFCAITYNLVVLFLQVISFTSSLVISSVQGNFWLNTKDV